MLVTPRSKQSLDFLSNLNFTRSPFRRFMHQHKSSMKKICPLKMKKMCPVLLENEKSSSSTFGTW